GEPGIAQGAADAQKLGSARSLAEAIAARVGLEGFVLPAYEDPWRHLHEEAVLPIDVDPLAADLRDPEERRRLARVLDRGLVAAEVVQQLLPPPKPPARKPAFAVRTALCVEPRGGALCVFLPPVSSAKEFLALIAAVSEARHSVDDPVLLEGYPPPPDPLFTR